MGPWSSKIASLSGSLALRVTLCLALLSLVSAAQAGRAARCTDLGPLLLQGEAAALTGRLGPWTVSGTADELVVQGQQGEVYRGPLADLHPTEVPALGPPWEAHAAAFDALQQPLGCPLGGRTLRLGRWVMPLPEGAELVARSADEAVIHGASGAAWLLDLRLRRGSAGELAAALQGPGLEVSAGSVRGEGWLLVRRGLTFAAPPGAVKAASQATRPWRSLLGVPPLGAAEEGAPGFGDQGPVPGAITAGRTLISELNRRRLAAGVVALSEDSGFASGALGHCGYLDWARQALPFDMGLEQTPSSPVFSGRWPRDRSGGVEVVADDAGLPARVVDRWLRQPFARRALLSPEARRVGACATVRGARVLAVDVGPALELWSSPADGEREVALSFDGKDSPEPIVDLEHPEAHVPYGLPISVYLPDTPLRVHALSGQLWALSGDDVAQEEPVATWVVAAPDGAERAAVHLIPTRPLRPGARYRWRASWRVYADDPPERVTKRTILPSSQAHEAHGSFVTRITGWSGASPLPPALRPALEALNRRRTQAGAGPLVPHSALDAAAWLYVQGGERGLRRVLGPRLAVGVRCVDAGALANPGVLGRGFEHPRFTHFGAALLDGQLCMVAAETPLVAPAWGETR